MEDENVRQHRPVLARKQRHQVCFDFDGVCLLRKAQTRTQAPDMSVDDDTFVLSERVAENDIGGFASDAGQFDESIHRIRNLAVVPLYQRLAESNQTLRFVAEEARAFDHLFQLILRCVG